MRNRNSVKNFCEKHGVLEIDELYIRDGEPKCNVCHKGLIFSEDAKDVHLENKSLDVNLNGGEDMVKVSIRGVRDELAEKLLTFAKRLDTGVKDNNIEHLKLLRKSISRVHFLLSQEIKAGEK